MRFILSIGELKREIWGFELEANLGLSFSLEEFLIIILSHTSPGSDRQLSDTPCKIVQAFWWLAVHPSSGRDLARLSLNKLCCGFALSNRQTLYLYGCIQIQGLSVSKNLL